MSKKSGSSIEWGTPQPWTRDALLANVRRGVQLLDTERVVSRAGGRPWRDAIRDAFDAARLDMGHCNFCVLGNLYGDFEHGLRALWLGRALVGGGAAACGFTLPTLGVLEPWPVEESRRAWGVLAELWREQVE